MASGGVSLGYPNFNLQAMVIIRHGCQGNILEARVKSLLVRILCGGVPDSKVVTMAE